MQYGLKKIAQITWWGWYGHSKPRYNCLHIVWDIAFMSDWKLLLIGSKSTIYDTNVFVLNMHLMISLNLIIWLTTFLTKIFLVIVLIIII